MADSRAIVVGGSVAGLLTAAALAGAFDEVLVLERDKLPEGEAFRPGVPQGRQAHGLLLRGAQAIENLLPGMREELRAGGAPFFDMGESFLLSNQGRMTPTQKLNLPVQVFSRNFLETRLRARVRALPGVVLREDSPVSGLLADGTGGRVTGVQVRRDEGEVEEIQGELVIDASGRNSRAADWLGTLGYPEPKVVQVDSGQSYATAWLGCTQEELEFSGILYEIGQNIQHGRASLTLAIQGQQMQMMLYGRGVDRPTTDPAEFREMVDRLGSPTTSKIAATIGPDTPIYTYAKLVNRRKLYHRMPRWPDRFLILGDSLCMFNPIYGQGMTVAAMQAEELRKSIGGLRRQTGWTRAMQRRLYRRTSVPWLLATAQDSRWAERPSMLSPAVDWLLERVMSRLGQSPQLHHAFLQMFQLLAPTALRDPRAVFALFRPERSRATRRS